MILRAWMWFPSHFSVPAGEYSGSNPDLTHYEVSRRISYKTGFARREGSRLDEWCGVGLMFVDSEREGNPK